MGCLWYSFNGDFQVWNDKLVRVTPKGLAEGCSGQEEEKFGTAHFFMHCLKLKTIKFF